MTLLKSKIHRAFVTEANLNYVGSITVDADLMDKSGIVEYEQVQVVDIDSGTRLTTYVIPGKRNSGQICLNGAAARLVQVGDRVIIMSYCQLEASEIKNHKPKIVVVGEDNSCLTVVDYENANETFEDMQSRNI